MSASRAVKLAGFRSVRHVAQLTKRSPSYIHKMYANDKEMFNALLEQAAARK